MASGKICALKINLAIGFTRIVLGIRALLYSDLDIGIRICDCLCKNQPSSY